MSNSIQILPNKINKNEKSQTRSCQIAISNQNNVISNKKIWFEYPIDLPLPDDDNCDSYLLATLLPAMTMKADIVVKGNVSKELLANLTELQLVWHKWLPDSYHIVEIKVDSIRENEVRLPYAVVAFSGGVDAQFSAYRHATGKAGYATKKLKAGVLIQGFDIPLEDAEGFSGATKKAEETLRDLGIDLFKVRTNISRFWSINWEHFFGIAVASVLIGFEKIAGYGILGSSESYEYLVTPWGSHPIIDNLYASNTFRILHDGAGFTRSEKLKFISKWEKGIKNLRVCYAGELHDRNCGHCEKCIRTQLNLILSGNEHPSCFEKTMHHKDFKYIYLRNDALRREWQSIQSEILNTKQGLKWLSDVNAVLKRKPKIELLFLFPADSKRRAFVKNVLKIIRKN
ncbi:hypothetical protein E6P75_04775 [Moraxella osloensis]|uniref:7-cyano-7-deazaguanine synthase n=1 Tax=Faucicola osloensis TaxID=34062 RepID=A0AAW6TA23_FAUOS|nr:hypothetical protein [Moraxella osloensis]MDI4509524.1 hypothetical protein [Moraxella osloensis]